MKALVIEDESRAASRLSHLLSSNGLGVEVVRITESVDETLSFLKSDPALDLIFSDVQLGDGLSFEVFEQLEISCPIIFTTAYDQYAIDAFKTNGIEYLLKPIDPDELIKAINKAKKLSPAVSIESILRLANTDLQKNTYKSRFVVKVGDKIKSLLIDDILVIFSHEKATFAFTREGRKYILDFSLDHVADLIDPSLFFRGSRKFLVSLHACEDITAFTNSRLKININGLNEPAELLVVARDRVADFKAWLDR